jgi:hypothetical protein
LSRRSRASQLDFPTTDPAIDEFEKPTQVTSDPRHLLEVGVELTRQADKLTLGHFRSARLDVDWNAKRMPVTRAEWLSCEELELRHPST